MSFRFEKLDVWQDARKFVSSIYSVTKHFPSDEKFGLTNQIRRAAVSIALNIAEGSDKKSDADFKRFLRMAIGSCEEVVTGMFIALDQRYVDKEKFDIIYTDSNNLTARIQALVKKL